MKQSTVRKQVEWIKDSFNRMRYGGYVGATVSMLTSKIEWLWKFRHIDEKTMDELTSLAIETMDSMRGFINV